MLASDPDNFDVPYQMAGISIEAVKFDDAGKYLEDDTDLLFSTELAAGVAFDFPDDSLRAWLLFLCHSELKLASSYTLKCLS